MAPVVTRPPLAGRDGGPARALGEPDRRITLLLAALGTARRGPASEACCEAERAFGLGVELRRAGASLDALRVLEPAKRPFAFEGAGVVDALGEPLGDERSGLDVASPVERAFLSLGRGIARSLLGEPCGSPTEPDDPVIAEGYGFGDALLRPGRALELAHEEADTGCVVARVVGIGRALWFQHAGSVPRLRAAVASCPEPRRPALWRGVGRAAIFTGGGPPERLAGLVAAAGKLGDEVLAGAFDAAGFRALWGLDEAETVPPIPARSPARLAATKAAGPPFLPGIAAVRGMGAVSAAGVGCDALLAAVRKGRSGIAPVTRFPTETYSVHTAALVPGWDAPPMGPRLDGHAQRLALAFARLAVSEALAQAPRCEGVTALVVGSNLEDRPRTLDVLFGDLADELGIDGPRLVVSTACASGTSAVGHALDILERGEADRVIVGGVDVITPRVFAGFYVLGALGERAAPLSTPAGMSLGEGAGFLVLERARTGDPTCVLGYGLGSDAFHDTRPAPDGHGVTGAVRSALRHAGLGPDAIHYVNAHGTGTEANDAAEWLGIRAGLGGLTPPTSSSKGLLGHAQGAAGALEVVLTLLCRAQGLVPPTTGFTTPRPGAPPDPVPTLRVGETSTFLSCSSAFGGVNAAVILGPARPVVRPARPVFIAGSGVWGPADAPLSPPQAGQRRTARAGAPQPVTPADVLRGLDPDALEVPVGWLCAAISRALSAAGVRLDRGLRARTGLVLGTRNILARDGTALGDEIVARGLGGVSGSVFARALLVSPAGAAATALGLLGPVDVVVAGAESGAVALLHAATLLHSRPELELMIAASVDDVDESGAWGGAVAVALAAGPARDAKPSAGRGRTLLAWTLAGSPEAAAARVRARMPSPTGTHCEGLAAAESLLTVMAMLDDTTRTPEGPPTALVGGRPGLGWAMVVAAPGSRGD